MKYLTRTYLRKNYSFGKLGLALCLESDWVVASSLFKALWFLRLVFSLQFVIFWNIAIAASYDCEKSDILFWIVDRIAKWDSVLIWMCRLSWRCTRLTWTISGGKLSNTFVINSRSLSYNSYRHPPRITIRSLLCIDWFRKLSQLCVKTVQALRNGGTKRLNRILAFFWIVIMYEIHLVRAESRWLASRNVFCCMKKKNHYSLWDNY